MVADMCAIHMFYTCNTPKTSHMYYKCGTPGHVADNYILYILLQIINLYHEPK